MHFRRKCNRIQKLEFTSLIKIHPLAYVEVPGLSYSFGLPPQSLEKDMYLQQVMKLTCLRIT